MQATKLLDPRRIITTSIVVLALLVFGLTLTLAWESHARYRTLNQAAKIAGIADDLANVASTMAVERGLVMMMLGASQPATTEAREEIAQLRRKEVEYSVHASAEMRELLEPLPVGHDMVRAWGAVRAARDAVELARSRLDACLAGRECYLDKTEWLATATGFIAANATLRDEIFDSLDAPSDIAQLNATLRRWLWTAAERSGRERAILAYHIGAGKPIPHDVMHDLQVNRALVVRDLAEVRGMKNHSHMGAPITAAIDGMDTAIDRFEQVRAKVYAEAETGSYSLTSRQWFREATDGVEAILAVGSAVTAVTNDFARKHVHQAVVRLAAHLAMLGFTVLLAYVSVTRVRQMANAIFAHAENVELEVQRKTKDLQASNERTRMVIENAPDAVVSMDADGIITAWNPSCERVFGWFREEVVGRDLGDTIIPHRFREAHKAGFSRFLREGSGRIVGQVVEVSALHRDGHEFPVELSIGASALLKGGEYAFTAFLRDITKRKQAEEELSTLANYDTLTGLPNRTLFMDRLTQALHVQQRHGDYVFALLFLDIDGFKNINDTLGHVIGDKLLQTAATRITACLRKCDSAARLGGDEFTIILERISQPTDVGIVTRKILDALAEPIQIDGHDLFMSASIGVTLCPDDGTEAADLLRNADMAMYQAKEQGRGCYVLFTKEMNERVSKRVALEKRLRTALEKNEFCLHYQPQVDLASGEIIGVEALLRWNSPDRGLVSPLEFIPVAEESGLIVPIGEWVLHTACAQAQAWVKTGCPALRMAVNLSGRQFRQQDLVSTVEKALGASGLDPARLELEITESMAMEDADRSLATLSRLKAMGVSLAVDDFGTGYSSLSYLKRFPIDTLKIDRSFIKDMTEDPNDAAIAASIIAMAHTLNLKVIAEGVETPDQRDQLGEYGCDEVQGYYFSKPLPVADITRILQHGLVILPLDVAA